MNLGQTISQYRKALGISQEELGARLGVSRQAVSKWETGQATPDMENLLALSREFGISVAELTATPEQEPVSGPSQSAPLPAAPERTARPVRSKGRILWILPVLLVILGGFGLYHLRQGKEPAGTAQEEPPQTEFLLLWDGSGQRHYLTLGGQKEFFPFGTDLALTAPETVTTEGTDLHLASLHHAVCGALTVDYIHFDADPEREQTESEWVNQISTMAAGYTTPRGIGVGSSKADVLAAYDTASADDRLVYCLKESPGYSLVPHDYFYAYQTAAEGDSLCFSLCFFMKDGLVAGICLRDEMDAGYEAYAPDNLYTFALKDGEPDFSLRQQPEQEPLSSTQQVYIAWNRLVTGSNLSAEEIYTNRWTVFSLLSDLDWQELGLLGATEHPEQTVEALLSWLQEQAPYSEAEIFRLQMGCTAAGLDGAYTDQYCHLLSLAFFSNPLAFVDGLSCDGEEETMLRAIRDTAYDAELYPVELKTALDDLDAYIAQQGSLTSKELGWARLLRLYLTTPIDHRNELPKSPSELEGAAQ